MGRRTRYSTHPARANASAGCRMLRTHKRAPKSVWSRGELEVLAYLLALYAPGTPDYRRAAMLFENRTAAEVKKRCDCIRDRARRTARAQVLAALEEGGKVYEPESPCSVTQLPREGRLHPTLVWVPPTGREIGPLNI